MKNSRASVSANLKRHSKVQHDVPIYWKALAHTCGIFCRGIIPRDPVFRSSLAQPNIGQYSTLQVAVCIHQRHFSALESHAISPQPLFHSANHLFQHGTQHTGRTLLLSLSELKYKTPDCRVFSSDLIE